MCSLLQNHCKDLRPNYEHLLRNLKATQAVLAFKSATFRRCYGAEFTAKKVRGWIGAVSAKTAFIAPGSPWENGYCERFNARFRDELLNGEVFTTLHEAQILIERWRGRYNTVRPHSALGYRPPAPKSIVPIDQRPTMHYHSNLTTQWGHTKVSATIPMIKLVCRMAMLPIVRRKMLCGLYAATLPQRH